MQERQQLLDLLRCWDARTEPIPFAELIDTFKGLELDRADLSDALAFDDRAYRRVVIWRRPHFEALVLCWKSAQTSLIHDHTGSSCAVRVVSGRATGTRFTTTPCGRLIPRRSRVFAPGAVIGCPGRGIHQMGHVEGPDCDLITFHVYSPPPALWRFYSLERTTLAGHDLPTRQHPRTIVVDFSHVSTPVPDRLEPAEVSVMETSSQSDTVTTIAIVGGGFSGAFVAAHLAGLAGSSPLCVALFEKGELFARGMAYATRYDHHLLNVPAGLMSALPDEPSHFLDWLRVRDPAAHHGTYAPRRVYGDYLEDLLAKATQHSATVQVDLIRDEVVEVLPDEAEGPLNVKTRSGGPGPAGRPGGAGPGTPASTRTGGLRKAPPQGTAPGVHRRSRVAVTGIDAGEDPPGSNDRRRRVNGEGKSRKNAGALQRIAFPSNAARQETINQERSRRASRVLSSHPRPAWPHHSSRSSRDLTPGPYRMASTVDGSKDGALSILLRIRHNSLP